MYPVTSSDHAHSHSMVVDSSESSTDVRPENRSPTSSRTTINRHIDFLDPIRGVAILLVFAYHSLGASFGRDQLP